MDFNPEKPFPSKWNLSVRKFKYPEISVYYMSEEYFVPPRHYHITPNLVSLRTQASVIFQQYAATGARDPVIPYLAMTYFDHYVSVEGVPNNTQDIAMGNNEENNYRIQLFLTCCFIIAWKMRKPRFWLPDFMIRYNLPYPIEEIENLEQLIDSWLLQHRQVEDITITDHNFKRPVTAFCFKDYLIDTYTFLSEDIKNCLKMFATHKLYALQYDIRYTMFRPSIVAAAAIAFCVDKYYGYATNDLLDAYLTIGGFNNVNLKLAIEMIVPGLTVYLFSDDDDDYSESSPTEVRVRSVREETAESSSLACRQGSVAVNRIDIEMLPPPNRIPLS